MAQRYNPPPNWPPPPPGWSPPPDWRPDPGWGPAPPGHQFWIEDSGSTDQRSGGSGLAIAALVVACLALLLSWIPIVNNFAFLVGIIALGFGIPALVLARRRRSSGQGLAVASILVAVLSMVIVIAIQTLFVSVLNEAERSISEDRTAADGAGSGRPSKQPGARATPLSLGNSAFIGIDYKVAVDRVDLHADTVIARANPFNEPPNGRYVLAELSVTYRGTDEGDPWIDLSPVFVGSDARQYDASECAAVTPAPAIDVPTLEQGGKASYQVCFDVPRRSIRGGKIFVQDFLGRSRVYWSIGRH